MDFVPKLPIHATSKEERRPMPRLALCVGKAGDAMHVVSQSTFSLCVIGHR